MTKNDYEDTKEKDQESNDNEEKRNNINVFWIISS